MPGYVHTVDGILRVFAERVYHSLFQYKMSLNAGRREVRGRCGFP